jgi:arginase
MPEFVCFGVPYFIGERIVGRTAVADVRGSGITQEIGADWIDIQPDCDDAPDPITAVNRALADAISAHRDRVPVVFASDCTSAIGAVKGLGGGVGVIWYDAHGDFNTPETTPSGFLGGMPLAMLAGRGDLCYMRRVGLEPLDERDIIITDARDLDPGEAVALRESPVKHLPDVTALLTAALPDKPLYVHLDTDVVNTAEMPGMAYPAAGGPSLAEVASTLERVGRDGQIAGLLVSLWNANLAANKLPLQGTLRLVRAFVGGFHDG